MSTPEATIPYGFCHCGCGERTKPVRQNQAGRDSVKGEPAKYVAHHHARAARLPVEAAPFKIEGVYCRLIPLQEGFWTIVNESDYLDLMQWSWYARKSRKGYYVARFGGIRKIKMHRQILGLEHGNPLQGEHKNMNTLDNRRDNLRRASDTQNKQNVPMKSNNTSGYKGVRHRYGDTFSAEIKVDGKYVYLGIRNTAKAAHEELYVPAALKYHGEFARTQ